MKSNVLLILCTLALSGMLVYVSDVAMRFAKASSHVHCAQSPDYEKCKTEFIEAVNKVMETLEKQ
jgi:hypothetical protein